MKVAYFVRVFPTLSQSFIQREILGLIGNGIEIEVFPCQLLPVRRNPGEYPFTVHYPRLVELVRLPLDLVREVSRSPRLLLKGLQALLEDATENAGGVVHDRNRVTHRAEVRESDQRGAATTFCMPHGRTHRRRP